MNSQHGKPIDFEREINQAKMEQSLLDRIIEQKKEKRMVAFLAILQIVRKGGNKQAQQFALVLAPAMWAHYATIDEAVKHTVSEAMQMASDAEFLETIQRFGNDQHSI